MASSRVDPVSRQERPGLQPDQPAGFEQYLREAFKRMAEGNPWSPAEMAEIASRYDFEPVTDES